MLDDNALMRQRRAKIAAVREAGDIAYPNDFQPTHTAADCLRWFLDPAHPVRRGSFLAIEEGHALDPERPSTPGSVVLSTPRVRVAGRALAVNVKGKVAFVRIRDRSSLEIPALRRADDDLREQDGHERRNNDASTFQIYFSRDDAPELFDRLFKPTPGAAWDGPLLDVGDVIGAEGLLFRTRTGEPTLWVKPAGDVPPLRVLTKAVRPLPDKWHGLADKETRFRQRYVDLIINDEVRETFRRRALVLKGLRAFLDRHGYVEVETPMMHPLLGGAAARPFVTHHNALDMPLYLRIAPELYLKRLVVGGIDRVYEINRNFRNEGLSQRHNPEFTMLEFYRAYATYDDLMAEVETLIAELAVQVTGGTDVQWLGHDISLAAPFRRVRIRDGLRQWAGMAEGELDDEAALRAKGRELGVDLPTHLGLGHLQVEVFEAAAQPHLVQPTFVIDYPASTSPLARRNDQRPDYVDRFELFIGGIEISNAFSELNDPEDQLQRFQAQLDQRERGDQEAMDMDLDYIRALEYGLPPTAGCGIGVDRLAMLLSNADSIRDVILFPHMRPEAPVDRAQGLHAPGVAELDPAAGEAV
jgi:lysyl-tRNA synthetase class 2